MSDEKPPLAADTLDGFVESIVDEFHARLKSGAVLVTVMSVFVAFISPTFAAGMTVAIWINYFDRVIGDNRGLNNRGSVSGPAAGTE